MHPSLRISILEDDIPCSEYDPTNSEGDANDVDDRAAG